MKVLIIFHDNLTFYRKMFLIRVGPLLKGSQFLSLFFNLCSDEYKILRRIICQIVSVNGINKSYFFDDYLHATNLNALLLQEKSNGEEC